MHMDPHILNYGRAGTGPRLRPGMALAIEPMITLGARSTREHSDGWTVSTTDGSCAAHWEHTVAILDDGPWVLTAHDGGRTKLAELGITVSASAGDS
jgi:methionyl aminopeptidase